jgi:hypothetical protein
VNYKPLDSGEYVINIAVNGEPIPQSPVHVLVGKSLSGTSCKTCFIYSFVEADALHCIAYG